MNKIILKIIMRRLQPIAEELMSEEKAGFKARRITNKHIFNLIIS